MRRLNLGGMKTDTHQIAATLVMVGVLTYGCIVEPGVRYVVGGFIVLVLIARRLAFKEWG